jgi:hypothetical protein
VRLVVRVRDAGYGPVEGAEVTGAVYTPDGGQTPFALVTDGAGEALFSFPTAQRGAHRVKVEGRTSRGLEGGQTVFAVSDRDPELDACWLISDKLAEGQIIGSRDRPALAWAPNTAQAILLKSHSGVGL